MARELVIDDVRIADDADCYVIAEIGHNHQGDVDKCKAMFLAAKEAGASAVKLQKRDNRALFTKAQYDYPYDNENSFGLTYGEHREALEFGRDEYIELQAYATKLQITFFATAFDEASVDFLADLSVPAIKIASGDLRSTHLLAYAADVGVPLILSTGAGGFDDVRRAVDTILPRNSNLALLQCTAAYPPEYDELDLRVIETYRSEFPDVVIGYSGHDSGIAMGILAYALGARIIEKHFTLNRAMKGTDHAFSLEPVGLRKLVRDVQRARIAFGSSDKRMHPSERDPGRKMGKKLVARHPLKAGSVLDAADVAMRSPGDGLWPYQLPEVLGRRLAKDLDADEGITFDVLAPADE
jgi:sialic acid synthase